MEIYTQFQVLELLWPLGTIMFVVRLTLASLAPVVAGATHAVMAGKQDTALLQVTYISILVQ